MIKHQHRSWQVDAPLVIAHRGASLQAPENTLAAFSKAVELKADAIEMDAKLTADQRVVIHHDPTLDRTTDGKGRVSSHTLSEIQRLDAGSKFNIQYKDERIPTIEEVFEIIGEHFLYNIELTNYTTPFDQLPEIVIDIIRQFGIQSKVLISSFNPYALIKVRKLEPEIVIGLLLRSSEPRWIRGLFRHIAKHDAVHPEYGIVRDRSMVSDLRKKKMVNVWTVNKAEEIQEMIELGVTGIITDDPSLARGMINNKPTTAIDR
jgi:glycerophosphoryl diester phosphodiesterase